MAIKNQIGIIGLGYVGLPLAMEFSKFFDVIGYDISEKRVSELQRGIDVNDKSSACVHNNFRVTSRLDLLALCDTYIVTVPTPVNDNKYPDFSPLINATKAISCLVKAGNIVIFESTVHPGATDEICIPLLEEGSFLKVNDDFFVGYSPERINPGDTKNTLTNVKKITSGSCEKAAGLIDDLYSKIIDAGTVRVSSIKVAEAAKILENVQRDVNIALMNEVGEIADALDIDIHEVIDAASTKWNFIRFSPGLVGGHCIGVDPYYLIHKASEKGVCADLMVAARKINERASKYHAKRIVKQVLSREKLMNGKRILILGAAFKPNCSDLRNSKIPDLWRELLDYGFFVDVYDPIASKIDLEKIYGPYNIDAPLAKNYSCVVFACHHQIFENDCACGAILENSSELVVYKI